MADSHRDEIARLEALHASHPEGRVFTHLAEAYRRAGDMARARQILDEGLARHPEYPSAYVVLGRLLLETGDSEAAAASFRRVLELDRHNVVALRALGELAEASGQIHEAIHYYEELSRVDPGNEALRDRIRELERSAPPPPAAWAVESDTPPVRTDSPSEEAAAAEPEAAIEPEPEPVTGFALDMGPASSEPESAVESGAEPSVSAEPASSDEPEPAGEPAPAAPIEPVADMVPELDEVEVAGRQEDPAVAGEWVHQDRWDRFARDDWSRAEEAAYEAGDAKDAAEGVDEGLAEAEMTDASGTDLPEESEADRGEPAEAVTAPGEAAAVTGPEWAGVTGSGTVEEEPVEPVVEPEDVPITEAEMAGEFPDWSDEAEVIEVVTTHEVSIEFAESTGAEPEADEAALESEALDDWVTETMAEVYAAQGLTERAVDVYRLLRRSHPDDARIAARLAELEEALAGPGAAGMASIAEPGEDDGALAREAWLATVESAWTGGEGAVTSAGETLYSWSGPEGEADADHPTAGDMFRALLGWRPASAGIRATDSEPAGPPIATARSASATEAPADELLLEEAVDEGRGGPSLGGGEPGSVEAAFEELFGDGEPSRPVEPSPVPAQQPASTERLPRSTDEAESEQDLEMFRTWLRSLRK
ncbi:MAG: tetratricopeptide repeat protein [Gemmatimonadetes bacterium]|nr:tetratricopeptide repeat protein [Gemmatimonadota bacterium]